MASVNSIIEIKPSQELLEAIESMQGIESMLKQAIREVLLSDEFLSAFAKAFANTPIPSTIQSVSDLNEGLVAAWTCEDGKAKQVYPEPKWTPKVGDWVRIKKPADTQSSACSWWPSMDKYDGQIIQVKQIEEDGVVLEEWGFMFDWLEPAEPQKEQPQLPDGWRWLEVGEVIRKGDQCFTNHSGWIHCLTSFGEEFNHEAHYPVVRRNRFEVGEKVVRVFSECVYEITAILDRGCYEMQTPSGYKIRLYAKDLAPYIEEPAEPPKEQPQPPDGWRWLEIGEVIRKGDAYWHGGKWWDYDNSIGAKVRDTVWPSIRRNRFVVVEKVVHVDDKEPIVYIVNGTRGDGAVIVSCRNIEYAISPNKLAPYIEETT